MNLQIFFICDQHVETLPSLLSKLPEWQGRVEVVLNLVFLFRNVKKCIMFDFKIRTDLLRLLLHPKTEHRHYVKAENTS